MTPAHSAQVRADLLRHHVSEREHVLVDLVLRLSFDKGRPDARIPRLDDFGAVTGFTKGNVHALVKGLVRARILDVQADRYRILPQGPVHRWGVRERVDLADHARALSCLEAVQMVEQGELLPADKTLATALAEVAVATAVPESGTGFVPESGTGGRASYLRYTYNVNDPERNVRPRHDDGNHDDARHDETKLRGAVLKFVGDQDFNRYWLNPKYEHVFTDDHCRKALWAALRGVHAALADGVPVSRTRGAMLWTYFGHERQALKA